MHRVQPLPVTFIWEPFHKRYFSRQLLNLHWKLEESTAPRHLKSSRSLSGRYLHLTLVTKWSWSWMTYSHPLCSMPISPPILRYSYFKIWPWTSRPWMWSIGVQRYTTHREYMYHEMAVQDMYRDTKKLIKICIVSRDHMLYRVGVNSIISTQLQLQRFQLQLQLRPISRISTPTPTPEVSTPTPIPTLANLQNINSNSNSRGFNSNSNSNSRVTNPTPTPFQIQSFLFN